MTARRVDGLLIERPGGEVLVIKESSNEAHALNETAAIVFELCDGATSPAVIAGEIARRTGLPVDESIVELALADLVEAGLVVLDEAAPASITRRSLIRRLALPAAALVLLPVVETIVVPSVATGQSAPTPTPTPTSPSTPTTSSSGD